MFDRVLKITRCNVSNLAIISHSLSTFSPLFALASTNMASWFCKRKNLVYNAEFAETFLSVESNMTYSFVLFGLINFSSSYFLSRRYTFVHSNSTN